MDICCNQVTLDEAFIMIMEYYSYAIFDLRLLYASEIEIKVISNG